MAKLTVSLGACDYDRTHALLNGNAPIRCCDVIAVAMAPEEAFHRAFRFQEFDITELSLSNYMKVTARGIGHYAAIPVFPSMLLKQNVREINAIARYAHEQGITARRLAAEDLFVALTFDLAKV
jgi:hypothetical protein